jgi:hypothetical protein
VSFVTQSTDRLQQIPGWMWPNLLSLDAPAVAVVWALLFARARGIYLSPGAIGALALAVWLIYLGDRVLDGRRTRESEDLRERHLFSAQYRTLLLILVTIGLFAGLWLVCDQLSLNETRDGLLIAACVGAYMICVHAGGQAVKRVLPKEVTVGLLFAAGTALPVWSAGEFPRRALISWLLFGVLCALNCAAIECWENRERLASPILNWVSSRIGWVAVGIAAVAGIAHFLIQTSGAIAGTIAIAAALILLLDCLRERLSTAALRVLADAALVVPALLALVVRI